ncbi:MAG: hypothetical protein ACI87X_001381 [Candidatus Arcticimaribacter sp.]|jgi:hypothetical protein
MENLTLDKHELGSIDTLIAEMDGSDTQPQGGFIDSVAKVVDTGAHAVEAGAAVIAANAVAANAVAATPEAAPVAEEAAEVAAEAAVAIMSKTQNVTHLVEKLNSNDIKDHLNLNDLIDLRNSIVNN